MSKVLMSERQGRMNAKSVTYLSCVAYSVVLRTQLCCVLSCVAYSPEEASQLHPCPYKASVYTLYTLQSLYNR